MAFAMKEILVVVVSKRKSESTFKDWLIQPGNLFFAGSQSEPIFLQAMIHYI